MTIRCVGCGRAIRVPEDKAQNPRLKVKCTCGTVFALAEAMGAAEAAVGAERTAVAPPSLTPVDAHLTDSSTQPVQPLRVEAAETPEPAAAPPPPRRTRPPGGWRRCLNHHTVPAEHVCPRCQVGYCAQCENKVRDALVCPTCESFCVSAKQYEEQQERARQRQRSMMEEIPVIATYPLRDPMGYVMLALFTGIFALCARLAGVFGGIGVLLSVGVLTAYCFYALTRVASGNLQDFMPQLGDLSDLVGPMRLGLAAMLISSGPLLLLFLWSGISVARSFLVEDRLAPAAQVEVVHADAAAAAVDEEEPGLSSGTLLLATLLLIPAILWKIVYTPVALTVAALSRSVLSTLNPTIGYDTIKRMGTLYWQAILIYTVLVFGEWLFSFLFSFIPFLGVVLTAFVDAYVYLAIGCTLGLAVFKRAPELGWE